VTTALAADLAQRLDDTLGELLEPGRSVALVNFANHHNPGDNAIWLGALAVLQRLRVPVGYASSWSSFSETALRAAVGDGPLLLNGGGTFGDLYSGQQGLREYVLERCTDRRIIQLPQSIWFELFENRDRLRRLCAAHPAFTLLVRERQSFEIAQRWFDVPALLCPDLAFGLGPLQEDAVPEQAALWIARRDREAVERGPPPAAFPVLDWLDAPLEDGMSPATLRIFALNQRLLALMRAQPRQRERRWALLAWTFGPLAESWLRRGTRIVRSAEVIITDRMHAHILAIMLGLPHVVLDNSYGKTRSTFETWTQAAGLAHWAQTTSEALNLAAELSRARR
jgi:exopolysaccharide biosynthesis predicted pyruvyltransferase EpsI